MKKKVCPKCGSNDIASIFWGYPADMELYLKAVKKKEIVPGGCCISDHDPYRECNDCFYRWGKRKC